MPPDSVKQVVNDWSPIDGLGIYSKWGTTKNFFLEKMKKKNLV